MIASKRCHFSVCSTVACFRHTKRSRTRVPFSVIFYDNLRI